jgi:hypothetical protein
MLRNIHIVSFIVSIRNVAFSLYILCRSAQSVIATLLRDKIRKISLCPGTFYLRYTRRSQMGQTTISAVLFVTTVKRVVCRTASPRKIAQRAGKTVVVWQQSWPTRTASSEHEGLTETNSDRTHKTAP